jgi:hypothetical protein
MVWCGSPVVLVVVLGVVVVVAVVATWFGVVLPRSSLGVDLVVLVAVVEACSPGPCCCVFVVVVVMAVVVTW